MTGGGFAYVWTAAASVWAADDAASALVRCDPAGRRVLATIPTGNGTSALHEEAGRIWLLDHRDGTLQRIDQAANTATTLARLPGDAPERIAYAEGSLWITGRGTDLLRVDPDNGAVQATIEIVETDRPSGRVVVNGTASAGTAFWLADTAGGRLYRVSR